MDIVKMTFDVLYGAISCIGGNIQEDKETPGRKS